MWLQLFLLISTVAGHGAVGMMRLIFYSALERGSPVYVLSSSIVRKCFHCRGQYLHALLPFSASVLLLGHCVSLHTVIITL